MLFDDLAERLAEPNRTTCLFERMRFSMPTPEQLVLGTILTKIEEDKKLPQPQRLFTQAWLVYILNKNGYQIGKTAVSDHLGGRCTCQTS